MEATNEKPAAAEVAEQTSAAAGFLLLASTSAAGAGTALAVLGALA